MAAPTAAMVRILVEAGATPASAARAAVILAGGGSYADAWAEIELAENGSGSESLEASLQAGLRRLPESNRWKVPVETAQSCGSDGDDDPSPALVTPRGLA